jgi:hypothetical protein
MDRPIEVVCYAGGLADERPEAIILDGARRPVRAVVSRWIEEGSDPRGGRRRCFGVRLDDGTPSTIYRDEALGLWFLREA